MSQFNTRIILLDGPKGAGKSSISKILIEKLGNIAYLSLDNERKLLSNRERSRTEMNKEAFEHIVEKSLAHLKRGQDVIIDCGLTSERVPIIEDLAKRSGSRLFKFFLQASYETLLTRVRSRDKSKGQQTDVERFDEVHGIINAKELKDFRTINTDTLKLEDVAGIILEAIES